MRAGGAPLGSATGNGHLLTKNLDIWAKLLITSVCSYESDISFEEFIQLTKTSSETVLVRDSGPPSKKL